MAQLNEKQKDAKILYLTQENSRLRDELLNAKLLSGEIRLKDEEADDSGAE